MPSVLGLAVGMLASLAVESLVGPYVTIRVRAAIGLVVLFSVAHLVRRQLLRLRDGRWP